MASSRSPGVSEEWLPARCFRFLESTVRLRSDSPAHLDLFSRLYSRFQVEMDDGETTDIEAALLSGAGDPAGRPALVLNGERWSLGDIDLLAGYAFDQIFQEALRRVRGYLLLHAGVVSKGGRGALIVADSTYGKTTLTLELVRRGFGFLSDEIAPIARAGGRVEPFPRSLRVRPGTLERLGMLAGVDADPIWYEKSVFDIEELFPGRMGAAVPVGHVFILHDAGAVSGDARGADPRPLHVLVSAPHPELLRHLERSADVLRQQVEPVAEGAWLHLHVLRQVPVLRRVEEQCRQLGILLLNSVRKPVHHPRFDGPARSEPMTPSAGVLALLDQYYPGHRSALLQDSMGDSPTRLFLEMAMALEGSSVDRLHVGPLADMADLVCDRVG